MIRIFRISMMISVSLVCLLLSACSDFNPIMENLMRPPRLTGEQKAIEDALFNSVISSEISFKYPKNGEYRSAFIFHDIDGDGAEEALVFYAVSESDYARLSILDCNDDGTWEAVYELPGAQPEVEFISFASVTGQHSVDIIIGWSGKGNEDHELGVYTYNDGALRNRLSEPYVYSTCRIDDLNRDGLTEIFLLSSDTGRYVEVSRTISLLTFDGYSVSLSCKLPLSNSISEFVGVTSGRLSTDSTKHGLFIDEKLNKNTLVTEVFTMEMNEITPVIYAGMPEPESILSNTDNTSAGVNSGMLNLYELTVRSDLTAICKDMNGDGIVEIPFSRLMPAYENLEESNQLYLTEYSQIEGDHLKRVFSAAVNRPAGYLVKFPNSWVDKVTIVNHIENNEWRFIAYNPETDNPLEDLSGELARIRVVSQKDYQDKELSSYTVLAKRGAFTYYAYIPESASGSLAVSADQFKSLFSLL